MFDISARTELAVSGARNASTLERAGQLAGQGKSGESTFARMLANDPSQDAKLKQSCQQMEGLLVKQMITVMRKSIEKSGFIDGGNAEEIFTDMLYDQYADSMSRSGDFGLSKTIYAQLTGGKKWV